jgi:hypothetical protein
MRPNPTSRRPSTCGAATSSKTTSRPAPPGDYPYDAFEVVGSALHKKIGVFHSSSLKKKMVPNTPNALYLTLCCTVRYTGYNTNDCVACPASFEPATLATGRKVITPHPCTFSIQNISIENTYREIYTGCGIMTLWPTARRPRRSGMRRTARPSATSSRASWRRAWSEASSSR